MIGLIIFHGSAIYGRQDGRFVGTIRMFEFVVEPIQLRWKYLVMDGYSWKMIWESCARREDHAYTRCQAVRGRWTRRRVEHGCSRIRSVGLDWTA